jgi:excisionase family DNA binding protein
MSPTLNDDLLTATELAQILAVGRHQIYLLVREQGLPALRLSPKALRFDRNQVAQWLLDRNVQDQE